MKKAYKYKIDDFTFKVVTRDNKIIEINTDDYVDEVIEETSSSKEAGKQLTEYFNKERMTFDLDYTLEGTEFQKQVWNQLLQIPYGKVKSYENIAVDCNNPKACRAVGNANNKNPIMIVVPCHRVIGKDKSLRGYGGGIDLKVRLLELEGYLRSEQ